MAKILKGIIVSTKMQGTVVVEVERVYRHPIYKKTVKKHKKYKAQNKGFELVVGDKVTIKETRPISKETHFAVIEKSSKEI